MKRKIFSKNLRVIKFFDQRNIGAIPRIFISSLVVLFFFYSMPLLIKFAENSNFEFQNNSKKNISIYTQQ